MLGSSMRDPQESSARVYRIATWSIVLLATSLFVSACSGSDDGTTPDEGNASGDDDADDDTDDDDDDDDDDVAPANDAGPKADASGSTMKDGGRDAGGTLLDSTISSPSDASSGDAGKSDASTGDPTAPIRTKCMGGSVEPCGVFVTRTGTEIPLGKYGAVMEPNVGKGFENMVNASDTEAGCRLFASLFGQDPASTAELLDIKDLDLKLYTIYRPANWVDGEKYPVVAWGNGTCAQPEGYGALLRFVASHGFVVVAPNSRYVGSGNEQRRGIDFVLKLNEDSASPYFGRIDPSKVAAMGHSQGSQGTIRAASDPRVKTVILFNGGTSASKPFFGVSSDRDLGGVTAASYRTAVERAEKAAFIFYHMIPGSGASDGHLTLMTQPERVTDPTAAWLKLMLNGDAAAREWFVGASCKLCNRQADFDFGQKGL